MSDYKKEPLERKQSKSRLAKQQEVEEIEPSGGQCQSEEHHQQHQSHGYQVTADSVKTADIYQSENTGDNVMHSEIGRTDDIPYHIVRSGPCHATVSVTSCSPTSGGDSVEDDYHDAIDDDDLATDPHEKKELSVQNLISDEIHSASVDVSGKRSPSVNVTVAPTIKTIPSFMGVTERDFINFTKPGGLSSHRGTVISRSLDDGMGRGSNDNPQVANSKVKVLVRSHALCDDASPPPMDETSTVSTTGSSSSTVNVASISPATLTVSSLSPTVPSRRFLNKDNSQGSTVSLDSAVSPCLSRDSSIEYKDSTGVDLEEFIRNTLNKNSKDRMMLFKLEQEMTTFINEESHEYLRFPSMSSYHRMLVHRIAAFFGLDHNVDQTGKCILVNRTPATRIPDFKFQDQISDEPLPADEPNSTKKQILKRDSASLDDSRLDKLAMDNKKSKSFEEREADYNKTRARIFNENKAQEALVESPDGTTPNNIGQSDDATATTTHVTDTNVKPNSATVKAVSASLESGIRPWSSTDSSSGYGTDSSSIGGRMMGPNANVPKAHSFGGTTILTRQSGFSGPSVGYITKSDSLSSGSSAGGASNRGGVGGLSHASISPIPPESHGSDSLSSLASSPHQHIVDGTSSGTNLPSFLTSDPVIWVATNLESIPEGSLIINKETREPFCNADGTVYRYRCPRDTQCQSTPNMPGAMQQMPQRSHLQMFNTQQHFNANQQNISIIENATVPVENSSQAISAGDNSTKQGVENTSGQQAMSDYQHQQYHQSMLTEQQSYVNDGNTEITQQMGSLNISPHSQILNPSSTSPGNSSQPSSKHPDGNAPSGVVSVPGAGTGCQNDDPPISGATAGATQVYIISSGGIGTNSGTSTVLHQASTAQPTTQQSTYIGLQHTQMYYSNTASVPPTSQPPPTQAHASAHAPAHASAQAIAQGPSQSGTSPGSSSQPSQGPQQGSGSTQPAIQGGPSQPGVPQVCYIYPQGAGGTAGNHGALSYVQPSGSAGTVAAQHGAVAPGGGGSVVRNSADNQSFSPVAVPVGPGTMQQTVSYPGNNNAPQQMYSIQTIEQPQNFTPDPSGAGAIQYAQQYGPGTVPVPVSQAGYVQNPTIAGGTTFYGVLPDGSIHCNTNTQGPAVPGARFVSPPGGAIPTGQGVPHRARTPPTVPTNPAAPNGQFIAYTYSATTTSNTVTNIPTAPTTLIRPGMVPHQMSSSSGNPGANLPSNVPMAPNYYPNIRPTRTTPPPIQPVIPSQVHHSQSPVQYIATSSACSSPSAGTGLPPVIAGSIQGAMPPSAVSGGTTFYQQPGSDHQMVHPSQISNAAAVAALTSPVLPGSMGHPGQPTSMYPQTQLVMTGTPGFPGTTSVIPVVTPNSAALALPNNKMMNVSPGALAAGTNPIRPLNDNVAPTNQNYIRGNIPMATDVRFMGTPLHVRPMYGHPLQRAPCASNRVPRGRKSWARGRSDAAHSSTESNSSSGSPTPTGCILEVFGLAGHIKCSDLNNVCDDLVRLGARLQPVDGAGNPHNKNLEHLAVGAVQQVLAIFDSEASARRAYDNSAIRTRYRLRMPLRHDSPCSTDNSTPNPPATAGHNVPHSS